MLFLISPLRLALKNVMLLSVIFCVFSFRSMICSNDNLLSRIKCNMWHNGLGTSLTISNFFQWYSIFIELSLVVVVFCVSGKVKIVYKICRATEFRFLLSIVTTCKRKIFSNNTVSHALELKYILSFSGISLIFP